MKLNNLQKELIEKRGARIVSLITIVPAELSKEGKDKYGNVYKISHINGIVNFNYQDSVNRQREREGLEPDFVSSPRKWGTKMEGIPFVSHIRKTDGKHELYLEIKIEKVIDTSYRKSDGDMIQALEIWPFIKKTRSSLDFQKITKEVIVRTYNVKNIISITFDGQTHILEP